MSAMAGKTTIEKYRDSFSVKRWHVVRIIQEERVGQHSAEVAMICCVLLDWQPSAALLMAALFHDAAEQWTGDIPAHVKRRFPEFYTSLKGAEATVKLENIPETQLIGLTLEEREILKIADLLALLFKSIEELKLGNRHITGTFHNGIKYLNALQWPSKVAGQVAAIREALQEEFTHYVGER